MNRQILFIVLIFSWTVSLSYCVQTGPLSAGAFRITFNNSTPWLPGQAKDVTIELMTSEWVIDTSNNNYQTTFVGVQGSPNTLYAQQFENANFQDFTYVTTATNQTTNLTIVTNQHAKGTSSSAMLVGGYQKDFTGPWIDFGANSTPVRLSAYMRASSAGIGGASMAMSFKNATGFYPAVQVIFDSDNNIKLKRLSAAGTASFSNSTPFSPNKWYKVDLLVNWTTSTTGFWVDGNLIASGFPFFLSGSQTVPYVNGINLWNNNFTTTWVDEIEVANSEVALADISITFSPGGSTALVKQGVWTGTVSVAALQPSMQLRAYRSTSILNYDGYSEVFSVVSPSPSPSVTPSITPTTSVTPSTTPSPSIGASPSPTSSTTPSSSPSPSVTPSVSPSGTPSSANPSVTPTPASSSVAPSATASFSPSSASSSTKKSNSNTVAIASGVSAGAFCLAGVVLFALVTKKFKKGRDGNHRGRAASLELPQKPIYGVPSTPLTDSEYRSMAIRYQDLVVGKEIGRGAFGSVFKASWRNSDCVVKQLNIDNTDAQAVNDFLKEATMVLRLRPHRNVCQIFGVCNNPEFPICIVMEYVAGGSLKELVYEPTKVHLTFPLVLNFAKDIASGMMHIHAENLLHCDLACRNLLASTQGENSWIIKVSDFGLARASESGIYDAKQEAKFPIRWSAPEVLTDRKVSRASDVWSFGVVLWEILEGKMPFYELMNNNDVLLAVCTKKEFLPAPAKRVDYPDQLYELMCSCWAFHPSDRPSFDEIYLRLLSMEPKKIEEPQSESTADNFVLSSGAHDYHEFHSTSEFDDTPKDNSNYGTGLRNSGNGLVRSGSNSNRKEKSHSLYGNKDMSQEVEEV